MLHLDSVPAVQRQALRVPGVARLGGKAWQHPFPHGSVVSWSRQRSLSQSVIAGIHELAILFHWSSWLECSAIADRVLTHHSPNVPCHCRKVLSSVLGYDRHHLASHSMEISHRNVPQPLRGHGIAYKLVEYLKFFVGSHKTAKNLYRGFRENSLMSRGVVAVLTFGEPL